jgi:hypothetical protein
MRWRLAWWREHGGGWVTKWVKGHVDTIAARTQATYTASEWANIEADRIAEWAHSQEAEAAVEARPAGAQLGGTWWVEQGRGYREKWWDGIPTAMWGSGREKEIMKYWEARQLRRGEGERRREVGWDARVQRRLGGMRRARKANDIFIMQRWWDHLPSPALFKRGKPVPGEAKCENCGLGGVMTAWHLIGECTEKRLVAVRRAVRRLIRAKVVAVTDARTNECRREWMEPFSITSAGGWKRPVEWRGAGDEKAGVQANPRYGCIPRKWLERWGGAGWVGGVVGQRGEQAG